MLQYENCDGKREELKEAIRKAIECDQVIILALESLVEEDNDQAKREKYQPIIDCAMKNSELLKKIRSLV
jgi:hypothetical protein